MSQAVFKLAEKLFLNYSPPNAFENVFFADENFVDISFSPSSFAFIRTRAVAPEPQCSVNASKGMPKLMIIVNIVCCDNRPIVTVSLETKSNGRWKQVDFTSHYIFKDVVTVSIHGSHVSERQKKCQTLPQASKVLTYDDWADALDEIYYYYLYEPDASVSGHYLDFLNSLDADEPIAGCPSSLVINDFCETFGPGLWVSVGKDYAVSGLWVPVPTGPIESLTTWVLANFAIIAGTVGISINDITNGTIQVLDDGTIIIFTSLVLGDPSGSQCPKDFFSTVTVWLHYCAADQEPPQPVLPPSFDPPGGRFVFPPDDAPSLPVTRTVPDSVPPPIIEPHCYYIGWATNQGIASFGGPTLPDVLYILLTPLPRDATLLTFRRKLPYVPFVEELVAIDNQNVHLNPWIKTKITPVISYAYRASDKVLVWSGKAFNNNVNYGSQWAAGSEPQDLPTWDVFYPHYLSWKCRPPNPGYQGYWTWVAWLTNDAAYNPLTAGGLVGMLAFDSYLAGKDFLAYRFRVAFPGLSTDAPPQLVEVDGVRKVRFITLANGIAGVSYAELPQNYGLGITTYAGPFTNFYPK